MPIESNVFNGTKIIFSKLTIQGAIKQPRQRHDSSQNVNRMKTGHNVIDTEESIRASNITDILDKPYKTIERHIKLLRDIDAIEYKGSKRTGGYQITEHLRNLIKGQKKINKFGHQPLKMFSEKMKNGMTKTQVNAIT